MTEETPDHLNDRMAEETDQGVVIGVTRAIIVDMKMVREIMNENELSITIETDQGQCQEIEVGENILRETSETMKEVSEVEVIEIETTDDLLFTEERTRIPEIQVRRGEIPPSIKRMSVAQPKSSKIDLNKMTRSGLQ